MPGTRSVVVIANAAHPALRPLMHTALRRGGPSLFRRRVSTSTPRRQTEWAPCCWQVRQGKLKPRTQPPWLPIKGMTKNSTAQMGGAEGTRTPTPTHGTAHNSIDSMGGPRPSLGVASEQPHGRRGQPHHVAVARQGRQRRGVPLRRVPTGSAAAGARQVKPADAGLTGGSWPATTTSTGAPTPADSIAGRRI